MTERQRQRETEREEDEERQNFPPANPPAIHTRSVQRDLKAVSPLAVGGGAVVVAVILSGHVADFEGAGVVHHATLVQAGLVLAAGRVQWNVVLQIQ